MGAEPSLRDTSIDARVEEGNCSNGVKAALPYAEQGKQCLLCEGAALFMQEKLHLSKKVEKRGCHNVYYPVIYYLACGAHDSELRSGTPAGKPNSLQQRVIRIQSL